MSRRTRNDSASISFNVNVPPEVIKEYFDGMAKVEAAKHSDSNSFGSIWSSLIPLIAPLAVPLISEQLGKSFGSRTPIRVPEPRRWSECSEKEKQGECDKQPEIVISFVQKPDVDNQEVSKEETDQSTSNCEEKAKEEKCEEKKDETSTTKSSTEKSMKRPAYEDDNMMHFDLGKIGAGFGGEGGLSEMMKMFGPMFQGLTSGLGGLAQQTNNTEAPKMTSSDNEMEQTDEEAVTDESNKELSE